MSNQVFIGTAIDVTDDGAQMTRKAVFRVEENFERILRVSGLINIFTHTIESACGLGIGKDEKYRFLASASPSKVARVRARVSSIFSTAHV